jgi:hypothetical protein
METNALGYPRVSPICVKRYQVEENKNTGRKLFVELDEHVYPKLERIGDFVPSKFPHNAIIKVTFEREQ